MRSFVLSALLYSTLTAAFTYLDAISNGYNKTMLGAALDIDPRFTLKVEYGVSPLPGMSILMNAVYAMTDLALEDFEEPIVPILYKHPDFPEVIIAPTATAVGGGIQTRFIVWGLLGGILAMAEAGKAQTVAFTLEWEGRDVGYIMVAKPRDRLAGPVSNITHTLLQRSEVQSLDKDHRLTADLTGAIDTPDDQTLTVSFTESGPALTGSDVLITVLYALAYVARFSSASQGKAFELRPPMARGMYIGMVGSGTTPFFQNRWIIETIAKIPQYMLSQHRFSSAAFRLILGSEEIGRGQIFKAR